MLRAVLLYGAVILCQMGCREGQSSIERQLKKTNFLYFEMSYEVAGFRGFVFCADSNKIFISPPLYAQNTDDKVKYGIVPDSLIQLIETTIQKVKANTSIKSFYEHCHDCQIVALKVVTSTDTLKVVQKGKISYPILKLINQLDPFLHSTNHNYFNALMVLETRWDIASPPPVLPLKRKGKNSR